MRRVVCIEACAVLACDVDPSSTIIRIAPDLVRQFELPLNAHTYLAIEYEGEREEVRFNGQLAYTGVLTIERTSPKYFPRGATVCFAITCGFLTDFVCQRASECAKEVAGTFGDLRGVNNVWTGFNRFNGGVQFGSALWSSNAVESQKLLKVDSGLWVDYSATLEEQEYGYLATVRRTAGAGATVGGKAVARTDGTLPNPATGIVGEAWAGKDATAPLVGVAGLVYNEASNNTTRKVGHSSVFRNRPDGASSTVGGLGTNRYNTNTQAYTVEAQPRSSDAEYCGWNRGIVFVAGGLDQSALSRAVGIDFSDIPDVELPRIDAALKLKAGLGIEWNGDSIVYDSFKSLYNTATDALEMRFKDNVRLSIL